MSRSALVAGGTGLVGSHLVKLLSNSSAFSKITVLIRKGSAFHMKGITVLAVDFERLEDVEHHMQAECTFCCLGTTIKKAGSKENFRKVDFEYPGNLAEIVLRHNCRQFNIVTASGANSNSFFFYNRVKGDVESSLKKLAFENLNIFRPSLLLGNRNEKRIGEGIGKIASKIVNPFLVGNFRKLRAIHAETVAKGMMQASTENRSGINIFESDIIQKLGEN